MNTQSIPFEITNVNHGFMEVKGLLHIGQEELVFEFDQKDAILGVIRSDLEEVPVSYRDLRAIEFVGNFFSARIEISGKTMRSLQGIPGADQGISILKIKRKHRKMAERAVSSARLILSEFRLKELDEG